MNETELKELLDVATRCCRKQCGNGPLFDGVLSDTVMHCWRRGVNAVGYVAVAARHARMAAVTREKRHGRRIESAKNKARLPKWEDDLVGMQFGETTEREYAVCSGLSRGLEQDEIARSVGVSVRTVQDEVRAIRGEKRWEKAANGSGRVRKLHSGRFEASLRGKYLGVFDSEAEARHAIEAIEDEVARFGKWVDV